MLRTKKKLSLGTETIRTLASTELRDVRGGSENSGPPPCTVVSPYNTCTTCPTDGCGEGTGWCGPSGTGQSDMTCTLV